MITVEDWVNPEAKETYEGLMQQIADIKRRHDAELEPLVQKAASIRAAYVLPRYIIPVDSGN